MAKNEIDETSGIETTGHEWDGIKELNNPLPRWWLWTFYATIIFSIGYMIYFPAFPLLEGYTPGISGRTNRGDLQVEMATANAAKAEFVEKLATSELTAISGDEALNRFATAGGKSAFKVYCSQCHGSGAQGGPGYPNLNDDDWIWGGDLEEIYTSIKHGVRNTEDEDTRDSVMPSFGADGILEAEQISQVSNYVLKISNQDHDDALAMAGQEVFNDNCTSCHSDDGTGDRDFGAPNLTDAISLYGNTEETIATQIAKPKHGVMPAWGSILSDETIKQLAVYVHGLGGGEASEE